MSGWALHWGTESSLADFVLLERGTYAAGTLAQVITFDMYATAAAA